MKAPKKLVVSRTTTERGHKSDLLIWVFYPCGCHIPCFNVGQCHLFVVLVHGWLYEGVFINAHAPFVWFFLVFPKKTIYTTLIFMNLKILLFPSHTLDILCSVALTSVCYLFLTNLIIHGGVQRAYCDPEQFSGHLEG